MNQTEPKSMWLEKIWHRSNYDFHKKTVP